MKQLFSLLGTVRWHHVVVVVVAAVVWVDQ
jgi:hypothetical protein